MEGIYGDHLAKIEAGNGEEVLPGISNSDLNLDLAAKIRQFLATLHNDGLWTNADDQRQLTEQAIERSGTVFGSSTPEQGEEILFSGNDKYGLIYGLITFESEKIPEEQLARDGERLYLGWYVELFNRYIEERPAEMYTIAKRVALAGLPMQPWIQTWMKQYEQKS